MANLSVVFTANRHLTKADEKKTRRIVKRLVLNKAVKRMVFGGAIGGDTVALDAAVKARGKNSRPWLIAVLPCKLKDQPPETWEVTRKADQIIELGNPITSSDGWAAFHKRNRFMVDFARKQLGASARVVGFTNRDPRSGTESCLNYADSFKKDGVQLKRLDIEGSDR